MKSVLRAPHKHFHCRVNDNTLVQSPGHVRLCATPWTAACQAPLSMGFSRQEYWRGLPCPAPRDLTDPGIKPRSLVLQADALPTEPPGKPHSSGYVV